MIVFVNGGFKTGSTWLYTCVRFLTGGRPVPEHFQREGWGNSGVAEDRLPEFLAEVGPQGPHTYAKSHYADVETRDLLLEDSNTRTLLMHRDAADIVVSAYHHRVRHGEVNESVTFDEFFWRDEAPNGVSTLRGIEQYRSTWAVDSPRLWATSYERFHADHLAELQRLSDFFGFTVEPGALEWIAKRTEFGNWKEKTGSKHLRRGAVGEGVEVCTPEMLELIEKSVPPIDPKIYG